jgi:hypothetical protein
MATYGRTLIVVLDDSRARFFRRESSGKLADGMPEVAAGLGTEGISTPATRGEGRRQFLHAVMTALEAACASSQCDRLMVVGPERMLTAFRKTAPDKVRVRFWREAAMEVKDIGEKELEKRLAPHFR